MSAAPLLETRRLVIRRGDRIALDALDLQVPAGCVYALLGGNGAGKTTALNALLGFVPRRFASEIAYGSAAGLMLSPVPRSTAGASLKVFF